MPSILLTFEDDQQREEFIRITKGLADLARKLGDTEETKRQTELICKTIDTATPFDQISNPATTNPAVSSCSCNHDFNEKHALFVSGKKMLEGTFSEMQKLFKREVTQHSGSVEVRIYREDKWRPVMQRPRPKI